MRHFYGVEAFDPAYNYWEANWDRSETDFIVRRVAVGLIVLINLGVIATLVTFMVMYTPIPTTAYLISPFVVGVISALIYMGYPTFGVTTMNYQQYTNPAAIIGKALAYTFFGPLMILKDKCDWTAYHDPWEAAEISVSLREDSFKDFADQYGSHFKNLVKYGFLPKEVNRGGTNEPILDPLLKLYKQYLPVKADLDFYKDAKSKAGQATYAKASGELKEIEKKWNDLRDHFIYDVPRFRQLPPIGGKWWVYFHSVIVGKKDKTD